MGTDIGSLVSKKEIELKELQGLTLGFDSFNMLYQFLSIIRGQSGEPLMDSKGRITSHLSGLFYRTINLIELGIKPVFVFDGKPSKLKEKTLNERNKIRTQAKEKFEKALEEKDFESAKKYAQQAVKLSEEMVNDSKKLLSLMGLPIVEGKSEGEAQIAKMVEKNDLHGCVSQDFDALLFGTEKLYRNIAFSGKRKLPGKNIFIDVKPEEISLSETLKELQISREKLVWIGILVGTDFNEKFPKIGPKTALKLVKESNSFEEIINKTNHSLENADEIINIFLNPEFNPDYEIKFKEPEKEKIIEFLCEEHDFSKERVESSLEKLLNSLKEKGSQARLVKWFQ